MTGKDKVAMQGAFMPMWDKGLTWFGIGVTTLSGSNGRLKSLSKVVIHVYNSIRRQEKPTAVTKHMPVTWLAVTKSATLSYFDRDLILVPSFN